MSTYSAKAFIKEYIIIFIAAKSENNSMIIKSSNSYFSQQ
jgi:hypothetical protein